MNKFVEATKKKSKVKKKWKVMHECASALKVCQSVRPSVCQSHRQFLYVF